MWQISFLDFKMSSAATLKWHPRGYTCYNGNRKSEIDKYIDLQYLQMFFYCAEAQIIIEIGTMPVWL